MIVTPTIKSDYKKDKIVRTKATLATVFILMVIAALIWQPNTVQAQQVVTNGVISYWPLMMPIRFFKDIIDEVTIYNCALSTEEVKQNMEAQGVPEPPEGTAVEPVGKLALIWGAIKLSKFLVVLTR